MSELGKRTRIASSKYADYEVTTLQSFRKFDPFNLTEEEVQSRKKLKTKAKEQFESVDPTLQAKEKRSFLQRQTYEKDPLGVVGIVKKTLHSGPRNVWDFANPINTMFEEQILSGKNNLSFLMVVIHSNFYNCVHRLCSFTRARKRG